MIKTLISIVLFFILNASIVFGQDAVDINNDEKIVLTNKVHFFIDQNNSITYDALDSVDFSPITTETKRIDALGKNIWLTFSLKNNSESQADYYLYFIDPSIHSIMLYNNGAVKKSGVSVRTERDVVGNRHSFKLALAAKESRTYYVKLFTLNKQTLNIELLRSDVYFDEVAEERLNLGLFYGGMILVVLYSLLLLVTTRFRMFAYFAGYVFFVGLLCGAGDGMTAEFFPWWVSWKGGLQDAAAAAVANILSMMFMLLFLKVESWSKTFYRVSVGFMLAVGISSFLFLLFDSLFIFDFLGLIGLLQVILLIVASCCAIRHKVPQAKEYLLAHLFFGVFVVLFILNLFRVVPYSFWTQYAIHLGYGSSLIILSFALGVRMYSYYIRLLKEEHEKQELIKQKNETLEEEVSTRTYYLEEKEGNLRSIIENNSSAIWLVDSQYTMIDFNSTFGDSWRETFGTEVQKGVSIVDQTTIEEFKLVWVPRYDAALKGETTTYYDQYKISDELRHFEIKAFPITESDQIRGVSLFSTDITDRVHSKKRLEKQNKLLKKVNQELDSFVYSASHDLKAPLASVLGLIQLSRTEKKSSSKLEYLDMMESSIMRLDRFIRDIIDYSRNARTKAVVLPINLEELINSAIEDLRYVYQEDQVKIDIVISEHKLFSGDETRLKVIVRNLLSNALKYGCNDTIDNSIDITLDVTQSELILKIQDYGPGIKSEYHNQIFEMFFRASENKSGTGLGLYIVKETVAKMRGVITLESEYGKGCCFIVKLPNLKDVS